MAASEGYVVLAEFQVKPDRLDEFLDVISRHAEISLAEEPGCLQFDVVRDGEDPRRVFLYEVYADEAAFQAHRGMPHMARTGEAIGPLIEDRRITTHNRVRHPRKAPPKPRKVLVAVASLARRAQYLKPLETAGLELVFNPHGVMLSAEQLKALLPGCVATIAGVEPYDDRTLAAGSDLKVIARMGVGYDQIDVASATRHGVAVAMAFGTNHEPVADFAFALMTALAHHLIDYDRAVKEGRWGGFFFGSGSGHARLHGTTVGVIGFGRIGRALAKRCQGFGMEVLAADPAMDAETVARLGCKLVPLDELLAQADFVSLHAPLMPETRNLIDARRLALMKPSAYLINTARGGMIDEGALAEALRTGGIAGAGLDVFATEPLPQGSPLADLPNVILAPHVAGSSEWSIEAMSRRCVENILAVLRREDPGAGYLLNPEVLSRTPGAV
jgi:D-3-phosphoglycerate dehydrogenase / 2-oxoglutarate reductase